MSSDLAIEVRGITKEYQLGERRASGTLNDALARLVRQPHRSSRGARFKALDGVDLAVAAGTAVGVIGRNGAGKSTLLKVLSRITKPTSGEAVLRGRVGSLLEVGTGFHPDLTGRENVFMNGSMLGMRRFEILQKFEEIVAFADVERFVDTPVKRYSSGMYVRLAFSVAAHLEPEILLIDEVLAVGDVSFQRKCLGKMQDVAGEGRTVVFVSHNSAALRGLTTTSVLLEAGRVAAVGPTSVVLDQYLSSVGGAHDADLTKAKRFDPQLGREVEIVQCAVLERVDESCAVEVEFAVRGRVPVPRFGIALGIFSADGRAVGTAFGPTITAPGVGGLRRYRAQVSGSRLAPGQYSIAIGTASKDLRLGGTIYDSVAEACFFEVPRPEVDGGLAAWTPGWGGVELDLEVEQIGETVAEHECHPHERDE